MLTGLIGLGLGLTFFHFIGRTERRFKASREVPKLLRTLLDLHPTSVEPDKGLIGSMPSVWPHKRAVDRLFLDWPGWMDHKGEVQVTIHEAVREAKRLGLVETGYVSNIFGHRHLFVGYKPEARRDCAPAPEACEQRRRHCGENLRA